MNDERDTLESPEKLFKIDEELVAKQQFIENLEKSFDKANEEALSAETKDKKSNFRRDRRWLFLFTAVVVLPNIAFCLFLNPGELRVAHFVPSGILGFLAVIWGHVYNVSMASFLIHRIIRYKK